MHVTVRLFTSLKEITGKKEETLEFSKKEAPTVANVLKRLAELHGKSFSEYVYDHKTHEARSFLQFLINGRNATAFQGLDTKLEDGDILAIVPPVGGG